MAAYRTLVARLSKQTRKMWVTDVLNNSFLRCNWSPLASSSSGLHSSWTIFVHSYLLLENLLLWNDHWISTWQLHRLAVEHDRTPELTRVCDLCLFNQLTCLRSTFRLIEAWEKMFGCRFFDQFRTTDFPMLIGVGRCTPEEKLWFAPPDYQHRVLMKGDRLTRNNQQATQESVLNGLKVFKEEFDRNGIHLVSCK